ncbi:MAG: hypothetical protein Ct9H90mP5_09880 [Acidimicrobiaceae bacterium]|nr:MAG: hypothetical protein Ct9H90mP5_09880 [Acidimicrobiaceae bacterium]
MPARALHSASFFRICEKGDNEKLLVELFCADTFKSLSDMCFGRETLWGKFLLRTYSC